MVALSSETGDPFPNPHRSRGGARASRTPQARGPACGRAVRGGGSRPRGGAAVSATEAARPGAPRPDPGPGGGGRAGEPAALLGRKEAGPGGSRALSELRFQRLLRTSGPEFGIALRRALPAAGMTCNVGKLGSDLLDWDQPVSGERVRNRWCFDYFGAFAGTGSPVTCLRCFFRPFPASPRRSR